MYFFVHLDYYDDNDSVVKKSAKTLIYADNYDDVMEALHHHFGFESIEKITLIEPITDNSVLYIDDVVEAHIREQDLNGF